ncbi:hypothetical protein HYQ46_002320 [Verticillium longisporum]|nr:hypothetical protein HYQ46_002320 [Verticillium longisporum]
MLSLTRVSFWSLIFMRREKELESGKVGHSLGVNTYQIDDALLGFEGIGIRFLFLILAVFLGAILIGAHFQGVRLAGLFDILATHSLLDNQGRKEQAENQASARTVRPSQKTMIQVSTLSFSPGCLASSARRMRRVTQ